MPREITFNRQEIGVPEVSNVRPVGLQAQTAGFEVLGNEIEKTRLAAVQNAESAFTSEARKQLFEAYKVNQNNPDGFKKTAEKVKKNLSKTLGFGLGEVREELGARFDLLAQGYEQKAYFDFQALQNDKIKGNAYQTIIDTKRDSSNLAPLLFSDDAEISMKAAQTYALMNDNFEKSLNAVGIDGAPIYNEAQKIELREETKRKTIVDGVKGYFEAAGTAEKKKEILARLEDGTLEVAVGINAEGKPIKTKARDLLDYETSTSLADAMEKQLVKEAEAENKAFRTGQALNKMSGDELGRGALLDPLDKDDKKAVDDGFEQGGYNAAMLSLDASQIPNITAAIGRAGIIPSQVNNFLSAAMTSGNKQQVLYASRLYDDLQRTAPNTVSQLPTQTIERGAKFVELVNAGVEPELAKNAVDQQFSPVSAEVAKARQIEAEKLLKDGGFGKGVLTSEESFFTTKLREGAIPYLRSKPIDKGGAFNVAVDYRKAFTASYLVHGDEKLAAQTAETAIKKNYHITSVGDKIMKYAPELYYPEGKEGYGWLKEQLEAEVKAKYPDAENISIISTAETASDVARGNKPRYGVVYTDREGVARVSTQSYKFDDTKIKAELSREQAIKEQKALYYREVDKAVQTLPTWQKYKKIEELKAQHKELLKNPYDIEAAKAVYAGKKVEAKAEVKKMVIPTVEDVLKDMKPINVEPPAIDE